MTGACNDRPWPPTDRAPEHDRKCLHDAPGPGGHHCDLGCEEYIARVEAYWEGYDAAKPRLRLTRLDDKGQPTGETKEIEFKSVEIR